MNTLQNLITLRDKAFPIVFDMDKQGRVDLNSINSTCGTKHCLWGWYQEIVGVDLTSSDLQQHFGINTDDTDRLFAGSYVGNLTDRYNYLCNLINEREKSERNFSKEMEDMISHHLRVHDDIERNKQLIGEML